MINWLLLICALGLSSIAGYYSIVGLASIFSAAFWPVIAMSLMLESSKLVIASWLYQRWHTSHLILRTYLIFAVIILMIITSMGIYGFLSKAHIDQGLTNTTIELQLKQIDSQIEQAQIAVKRDEQELQQLDRSIDIQLNANKARQALASRKQQDTSRTQLKDKLDTERKTIEDLDKQKTSFTLELNTAESKVGPIKYIAELFSNGQSIDLEKAVRYMILLLVMVFDPLAIVMIIAANSGFSSREKSSIKVIEPIQIEVDPLTSQKPIDINHIDEEILNKRMALTTEPETLQTVIIQSKVIDITNEATLTENNPILLSDPSIDDITQRAMLARTNPMMLHQ